MTIIATLFTSNHLQNFYFKNFVSEELYRAIAYESGSYPERYAKMFVITEAKNGKRSLSIRSVLDERIEVSFNGKIIENQLELNDMYFINVFDKKLNKSFQLCFTPIKDVQMPMPLYKVNKNEITIGRDPSNIIAFTNVNTVSRRHAQIDYVNEKAIITDHNSRAKVYVNEEAVVEQQELKFGDTIQILHIRIIYLGDFLAISETKNASIKLQLVKSLDQRLKKNEKVVEKEFSPTARIIENLIEEEVNIDLPPAKPNLKTMPLIFTIGPSATMALAMVGSLIYNLNAGNANPSNYFMTGSLLLGAVLWPILNLNHQKRGHKKDEEYRVLKYRDYLRVEKEKINKKIGINLSILNNHLYPNPERIISFSEKDKRRNLWNKGSNHKDFLDVRLGTGDRDSTIDVHTSKQGFSLHDDSLKEELNTLIKDYEKIQQAPITLSLVENQLVGIYGEKSNNINFLNNILLNVVGLHNPQDVKVVLIHNEKNSKNYEWLFEMPHLWNDEKSFRFSASNKKEFNHLFTYLTELFLLREENLENAIFEGATPSPRFIFVVTDPHLISNEPFTRHIYNSQNRLGMTTLVMVDEIEDLPKDCSVLIETGNKKHQMFVNKMTERSELIEIQNELVDVQTLENYSKEILKVAVKKEDMILEIPSKVGFLEMYSAGKFESLDIENLWRTSKPYESLSVPIGYGAGGQLFDLDIHENFHGPHGLVAGTTGSGKSEFLQSYIISAAINFHPHDIAFVLIDYKGGGMANIFDDLPHLAGKITNLSGNMLQRSLNSIEAELKKRQRYFSEYNVNHIDKYQALYKEGKASEPLPHLVLIADEFAQLKSQQPEFMRKLIDIAQIGRSLGVHLILATQKPAGLVDDQIWGNTRFRVCLKVADKQDSNEMLRKPDAAMIKLPGRCYVQVGYDEIYESVQSAYSGLEYEPLEMFVDPNEITVKLTDKTATVIREQKKEIEKLPSVIVNGKPASELEGLIKFIANLQKDNEFENYKLWLEPLSSEVYLHEIEGFIPFENGWTERSDLNVVIGIGDYTNTQSQRPVVLDLIRDGHVRIHGASTYGKTTLLQTTLFALMSKYSPSYLNLYVFDFVSQASNSYVEFPHCEAVVTANDATEIEEKIEEITNILEARKEMFAKVYAMNSDEYTAKTGEVLPKIIIAMDGMEQLKVNDELISLYRSLVPLLTAGRAYGMYFIITANNFDTLHSSIRDNISTTYSLCQYDNSNYRDVFNKATSIFPEHVKGRGLHVFEDELFEVQFAIIAANEQADSLTKSHDLTNFAKQMMRVANEQGLISNNKKFEMTKELNRAPKKNKPAITLKTSTSNGRPKVLKQVQDTEGLIIGLRHRKEELQYVSMNELNKFALIGSRSNELENHLQFIVEKLIESEKEIIVVDHNETLLPMENSLTRFTTTESSLQEFTAWICSAIDKQKEESNVGFEINDIFVVIHGFIDLYDNIRDEDVEILEKILVEAQQYKFNFIVTETNLEAFTQYNVTGLYQYCLNGANGLYYETKLESQPYFLGKINAVDQKYSCKEGEVYTFLTNDYGLIANPYVEVTI